MLCLFRRLEYHGVFDITAQQVSLELMRMRKYVLVLLYVWADFEIGFEERIMRSYGICRILVVVKRRGRCLWTPMSRT